ncbi:MAG: DUF3429 domain-containing protein [Sulfitobacter sp.]
MSPRIPAAALLIGFAGLLPFLWGALVVVGYFDAAAVVQPSGFLSWVVVRDGPLLMARYGVILLCFATGALWGLSSNVAGLRANICFALSVIPALWIFLNPGQGATSALTNLMIGFAALLMLDAAFWRWGLAPAWWMSLRLPLTLIVLGCLALGVWG